MTSSRILAIVVLLSSGGVGVGSCLHTGSRSGPGGVVEGHDPPAMVPAGATLGLLFSGNTAGEIEPCG